MRSIPLLATFVLLATLVPFTVMAAFPAAAQPPEPPSPPPPPVDPTPAEALGDTPSFDESVSVTWVLVPVVVRDRQGHVEGLERDDFRLFVDDRRVPVRELDLGSDVPLSVVYLQDLSGSMANGGKMEASRRALGTLIDATRESDQVALSTFAGGRLIIEVPFTDDTGALRESMATWEGYGTTALHDAVSLLPDISEGGKAGRRVAILVTDGLDNASALDPEEALRVVREARLPVYVIGLTAGARGGRSGGARGGQGEEVLYSDLLANLAERTGGRYFEVAGEEEATTAVADLVEDLRSRYVLGITTAGDGARTYHPIRVEVTLPYRHTLTYRRGYTGTAPE
jgi:VWFA-related protein